MNIHKPSWFSNDAVMVSTALTCGLAKGGRLLPVIDPITGRRVRVADPDTSVAMDAIDDKLKEDSIALLKGELTDTLSFVPIVDMNIHCAVPIYYDYRYRDCFNAAMQQAQFSSFKSATIGELIDRGILTIRSGHGSPTQDQRIGDIPYIKVSDLRAGLVNINPTNRIPVSVAKRFWGGNESGLKAFDLLSPERTSRNIGEFCVLLPGQERVVMTKEIIVMRPGPKAEFDPFYLIWALSLKIVRDQWRRVIFMQTNREDVGKRYFEILVPVPPTRAYADDVSKYFRVYYQTIAKARSTLADYLRKEKQHHFFVSGNEKI